MNERNSLALITGASSGIGLELARCFVRDGHDVVLVAEDRDGLDAAAAALRGDGGGTVDTIVPPTPTLSSARMPRRARSWTGKLADPADVARAGYDALMRGDAKIVVPLSYKIQTAVNQVIPDKIVARQSMKKHEPRDAQDEERP